MNGWIDTLSDSLSVSRKWLLPSLLFRFSSFERASGWEETVDVETDKRAFQTSEAGGSGEKPQQTVLTMKGAQGGPGGGRPFRAGKHPGLRVFAVCQWPLALGFVGPGLE